MGARTVVLPALGVVLLMAGGALAGPAGAPASQPAVAVVNGQPISRQRLVECLIEAHGRRMLEHLVALELVRQKAGEHKLTVTEADIAAEEAEAMPEELKKYEPRERDRVFDDYLERNGLTRVEWRLIMEIYAHARKLASTVPEPTEEQLRELFNRRYGERVVIRDIQLRTPADLADVERRLKAGERFELVAREMSIDRATAVSGGACPPFDRNDRSIPEEVRAVAFALQFDGDVSGPIYTGGVIHKIKRIKRLPPEKEKFEDVRAKLAAEVRKQIVRRQMQELLPMLRSLAAVEVLDPVIKRQIEKGQTSEPAPGGPRGRPGPIRPE